MKGAVLGQKIAATLGQEEARYAPLLEPMPAAAHMPSTFLIAFAMLGGQPQGEIDSENKRDPNT
ncbi:MAG: hypothetical protein MJE77_37045 [Proteobacteria bacterium]|nr:hypothetical protein [Pseudomonadota bacterium]